MKMMKRIGIVLAIITLFASTFAFGAYANKLNYLTFDKGDESLTKVDENMNKDILDTIHSEKEQALDKIDDLKEDNVGLKGDKQAKDNENKELTNEVQAKKDQIAKLEKEQEDTKKNHKQEINKLNKQIKDLEKDIKTLNGEAEEDRKSVV